MDQILAQIKAERERQKSLQFNGVPADEYDKSNSQSDWITFITRFASGSAPRLGRKDSRSFRDQMVVVAALAVAAIENNDAGNCPA